MDQWDSYKDEIRGMQRELEEYPNTAMSEIGVLLVKHYSIKVSQTKQISSQPFPSLQNSPFIVPAK
jgi:hypothetical protein